MTITVNGDSIQVHNDSLYPFGGYLLPEFQSPVEVYYTSSHMVGRGDIVRLSSEGGHELFLGPHRIATVYDGIIHVTVNP